MPKIHRFSFLSPLKESIKALKLQNDKDFAKKCALIAFNVLFVCISISYPLAVYFGKNICAVAGVMALAWGIKAFLSHKSHSANKTLSSIFALLFGIIFLREIFGEILGGFDGLGVLGRFISLYEAQTSIVYFYPVCVYLLLLCVFALSLKGEALITRFAMHSHGVRYSSELPKYVISYTRTLTKIWILYFGLSSIIAFILALLEEKLYWSLFCGGICYVALGLLFGIEWIYRTYYFIPKHKGLDNV